MRRGIAVAAVAAVTTIGAAFAAAVTLGPGDGTASSHREAPLISEDPSADLTDVYAFRSPDKPNTVTILANVIPGEDPAAGPNWFTFSPGARYNLKIDTTGDVRPDVIYRFEFKTKTGQFFLGDTAQPFTLTRIAKGKIDGRRAGHDPAEQHRQALDARVPARSQRRASFRSTAAPRRRSLASVTIRSSATSARSSISSRSARAPATWAAARTSSPAMASTPTACRCPSRPRGEERHDRRLGVGRPPEGHHARSHDPERRRRGSRSTASATRSSTR